MDVSTSLLLHILFPVSPSTATLSPVFGVLSIPRECGAQLEAWRWVKQRVMSKCPSSWPAR